MIKGQAIAYLSDVKPAWHVVEKNFVERSVGVFQWAVFVHNMGINAVREIPCCTLIHASSVQKK